MYHEIVKNVKTLKSYLFSDNDESIGKFIGYSFFVIPAALVQIWLVALVTLLRGDNISIVKIAADGSLLFFSTALHASTLYDLALKGLIRWGEPSVLCYSLLTSFAVWLMAIAGFFVVVDGSTQEVSVIAFNVTVFSIAAAAISILYSLLMRILIVRP